MYQVGLTGGIASGKTTVSSMFADKGAVVIDADRVARDIVEPGMPALAAIEARFGFDVITIDGRLDREALGEIVFNDPEANQDLRAITHPEIGREIAERLQAQLETENIVILDAALLVESGWQGLGTLIVVAADPDVQIERMMRDRDMTREEAQARIDNQAALDAKLEKADIVIWNNAGRAELAARVDEVWDEILAVQRENRSQT